MQRGSRMISVAVSNNFTWVSVDARPGCVFWRGCRHNSINKNDPYGAADVVFISLCSTIEPKLIITAAPPKLALCFCCSTKKKSLQTKLKQKVENRFSLWGVCIWWNCPHPEANSLSSRTWRWLLKTSGFVQRFFAEPRGSWRSMKEFPKEPSWSPDKVWRFFEEQLLLFRHFFYTILLLILH